MTKVTLALAIAATLFGAAAFGWIAGWLWSRSRRGGALERERARQAELAAALHAAEAARDAAERRAEEAETARDEARAAAMAETRSILAERQAELDAAMETVGRLRQEAAEWRSAYESSAASSAEA